LRQDGQQPDWRGFSLFLSIATLLREFYKIRQKHTPPTVSIWVTSIYMMYVCYFYNLKPTPEYQNYEFILRIFDKADIIS